MPQFPWLKTGGGVGLSPRGGRVRLQFSSWDVHVSLGRNSRSWEGAACLAMEFLRVRSESPPHPTPISEAFTAFSSVPDPKWEPLERLLDVFGE